MKIGPETNEGGFFLRIAFATTPARRNARRRSLPLPGSKGRNEVRTDKRNLRGPWPRRQDRAGRTEREARRQKLGSVARIAGEFLLSLAATERARRIFRKATVPPTSKIHQHLHCQKNSYETRKKSLDKTQCKSSTPKCANGDGQDYTRQFGRRKQC